MRTALYALFVFVPLSLTSAFFVGCGSDDTGGGPSGSSSSGGGGSGGSDPCGGRACGDTCTTCPPGAPCMPMACDAMGACVLAADAVCSLCPAAEPAEMSPCPKVGLVCDLDDGFVLTCRARTQCTDKGWQNLAPGCSSTPTSDPGCPASAPTGACNVGTDPPLCAIGADLCGCVDPGTWLCAATPAPPCPPTAPKLGAVCTDEGAKCVYGDCKLGGTASGRDCFGGIWVEHLTSCI